MRRREFVIKTVLMIFVLLITVKNSLCNQGVLEPDWKEIKWTPNNTNTSNFIENGVPKIVFCWEKGPLQTIIDKNGKSWEFDFTEPIKWATYALLNSWSLYGNLNVEVKANYSVGCDIKIKVDDLHKPLYKDKLDGKDVAGFVDYSGNKATEMYLDFTYYPTKAELSNPGGVPSYPFDPSYLRLGNIASSFLGADWGKRKAILGANFIRTSMHEFGHILGFAHEHNWGSTSYVSLFPYADNKSVMYTEIYLDLIPTELACDDIKTVRYVYGMKQNSGKTSCMLYSECNMTTNQALAKIGLNKIGYVGNEYEIGSCNIPEDKFNIVELSDYVDYDLEAPKTTPDPIVKDVYTLVRDPDPENSEDPFVKDHGAPIGNSCDNVEWVNPKEGETYSRFMVGDVVHVQAKLKHSFITYPTTYKTHHYDIVAVFQNPETGKRASVVLNTIEGYSGTQYEDMPIIDINESYTLPSKINDVYAGYWIGFEIQTYRMKDYTYGPGVGISNNCDTKRGLWVSEFKQKTIITQTTTKPTTEIPSDVKFIGAMNYGEDLSKAAFHAGDLIPVSWYQSVGFSKLDVQLWIFEQENSKSVSYEYRLGEVTRNSGYNLVYFKIPISGIPTSNFVQTNETRLVKGIAVVAIFGRHQNGDFYIQHSNFFRINEKRVEAITLPTNLIVQSSEVYFTETPPIDLQTDVLVSNNWVWIPYIDDVKPKMVFMNNILTIFGTHLPLPDESEIKFNGVPGLVLSGNENKSEVQIPYGIQKSDVVLTVKNTKTGAITLRKNEETGYNEFWGAEIKILSPVPMVYAPLLLN